MSVIVEGEERGKCWCFLFCLFLLFRRCDLLLGFGFGLVCVGRVGGEGGVWCFGGIFFVMCFDGVCFVVFYL